MEEFSKNGRKLRPRRTSTENRPSSEGEHRSRSSEGRPVYSSERRPYGEHSGEHRSYGGGERRSYGSAPRRPYGENKPSYGEHREGGERPHRSYGEGRPAYSSERRPYGEHRDSENGEHRSYGGGERRSYGSAPRRPYGEHRPYNGGHREEGEGRPAYNSGRRPFGGERHEGGERRSFGGGRKPGFGPRKPGFGPRRQPAQFSKESEEGINRMLSRKPVIGDENFSGEAPQEIAKDEIRLNKFIANSGVCSRREADTLIQAGVVTVNGEVVTELGTKVNIFNDDVRFNGERLKGEEKVYIVMNKPAGYVTTSSDPHADKTVMELLKNCDYRVFPVGRLDKSTTGVLMFTNDGEISERLTHPSYCKKKIYQVILSRELAREDYDKILSGVTLSDGDVAADELEYIDENDHRKLGIEIHSGKNRIVRRIFESLGYDVRALDRVYFAGLTKKGLKKGEWRVLTESEVSILKMGAYV